VHLLHQLFETQADRRPLESALIFGDRQWNYQQVECRANQLARHLRTLGACPGRLVGLYLDRSDRAIVSILAVLKSGAAYVAIDPVNPVDRIRHILAEGDVLLIVTERRLATAIRAMGLDAHLVVIDEAAVVEAIGRESVERLAAEVTGVTAADLCYVTYTSGTTGRPKGIMAEHRHVLAFTKAFQAICRIGPTDRVFQGFSLGFDGSVEEYVLAFAGGAPLVVGPPAIARHGDETADYLTAHGVTYFSTVPTFLRLVSKDLPSVRLLVVSGEPCAPDLVRRWAEPGRRMLNVYGPTEATVNTTCWECRPDTEVLIGRPLDGYRTYILDAEQQPVRNGPGELYVGGDTVARGYLSQPAVTAAAFVADPFSASSEARLYRTGDLVEETRSGELRFLGRRDGQVKIRGFRIELLEIESALRGCPGVNDAVVTTMADGAQTRVAAFVVGTTIDRGTVLQQLRRRLPPHMIPSFLDAIAEVPRLASGKVDRRSLPPPRARLVDTERPITAPSTEWETRLVGVCEELCRTAPISIEDDFFVDLGGDSLLAAQLVTALNERHGATVSLREVYAHPTLARLAARAAEGAAIAQAATDDSSGSETTAVWRGRDSPNARDVWARTPRMERLASTLIQATAALVLYGLAAAGPLLACLAALAVVHHRWSTSVGVAAVVGLVAMTVPAWLAVSVAAKWLVIGRYREGQWSAYGLYAARFWIARRAQVMSGAALLAGTPAMASYYRLMGANVGRGCLLDTAFCAAFDLVTIGDDSSIGAETELLGYSVRDGLLVVGPITIGGRSFVGTHSSLGPGSRMGSEARLGDLSRLGEGASVPDRESWRGSPASPGPVAIPDVERTTTTERRSFSAAGMGYAALAVLLELIIATAFIPAAIVVWLARTAGWTGVAMALVAAVPLLVFSCSLVIVLAKWIVLKGIEPGVYPAAGWLFVRKWFVDGLVGLSRIYLRPLYTTIYLPTWLRWMGARIGRLSEISTIAQGAPDLFDLGDQSFFADGSMIGGRRFHRGHVQVARSRIGRRTFVGNSAVLSVGCDLGDECLLGVVSTPPEAHQTAPDHTEWLGSPAFALPHRRRLEGFDPSVTFEPTRRLYVHRLIVDAVRILVPGALVVLAGTALYVSASFASAKLPWGATFALLPILGVALAAAVTLAVAILKGLTMGRFAPVIKPLWSPYVWWNEVVNGAWETVAVAALVPVVGTPFFNVFLRLMGCQVGPQALIYTTLFSEFDLVSIGGWTALNEGVVVQNHLFEDRVMKSSYIRIRNSCSVGALAVVLYDTEIQERARLDALSLVMKGSVVPEGARWGGIPAGPTAHMAG
jgi:non-ribosomal peptide synthetase-like protein